MRRRPGAFNLPKLLIEAPRRKQRGMRSLFSSKGHKTDLFFIDNGVNWANSEKDLNVKTATGDCPNDYLPYLVEKQVAIGV
ncbi:MAG: DsrE family protein [Desulfobacterales bacterium]|nr:DsrE family protein [Desulfobacterales bacterium]